MKTKLLFKKLLIIPLLILMFFNTLNTNAQSCLGLTSCNGFNNPYGCFTCGNCVWYARNQVDCRWGVNINITTNANTWASKASILGYTVSSTPVVNSIACSSVGGFGHVAVVEEILPNNKIRVTEMNYQSTNPSCPNYGGAIVRTKDYSISFFDQGFIHPPILFQPLNQSLPIYGGKVSAPKSIDLFIPESSFPNNFQTSQVSNIQITMSGLVKNIPSSRITGTSQEYIPNYQNVGIPWRKISLQITANDISGIPNSHTYGTISFDLNNGGTKKYQNNNIYFTDFFNTSTTLTDVNDLDNWAEIYVRNGANQGLFRGTSLTTFLPAENLTREQAAIVLVNAASRLKLLSVETSTSINGSFADVSSSHRSFKYIQTLRNYGFISANTNFNPENFITVGEFCKMLANTFKIQSTDYAPAVFLNGLQRRIIAQHSDPSLQDAMTRLLNIVDIREKNGFWVTENNWDFFDFSSISSTSSSYIVYGTAYVNRATMAKVMYNLANWKARNTGVALQRNALSTNTTPNISDMVAYGEKYDNASITATSTPITPAQQTYSVASGGSVTISYNPGSLPQHYYWSMQKNNGSYAATLASNNSAHSSVTFTAPTVSVPTQWKLYTYTANNKGKARETFITINVGGSAGGTNAAPTQQAHSLILYGETTNGLTASWTRGNGQNCIVTCKEVSANAQVVPVSGVVYTGNTNFASAPSIFNGSDTKVVYTGTGSSCNITGLNPNTQYQIAVFEYNGTTPSTVLYNLSNAPVSIGNTISQQNLPVANVFFDYALNFQINQTYSFSNSSYNANTFQWSITNGATIANPTTATVTNITFYNTGLHILTLTATNSTTGQINTQSYNIYVYNDNAFKPDIEPVNLNFITPSLVGGVQNFDISCQVRNNSTLSGSCSTNIKFAISIDQIWDSSDILIGSQNYSLNSGQIVSITHSISGIPSSAGSFYVLAKVDEQFYSSPNGNVDESNENNNIISKQIELVTSPPDFTIASFSAPSIINPEVNFTVSGTFRNVGQGHANNNPKVNFYLSTDNILSDNDFSMNGLISNFTPWGVTTANGPIASGSTSFAKFSASVPNGNYYLIAKIMADNEVEINQTNNTFSLNVQVIHPNQPTINASNFNISNITSNSLRLNWTRGNGNACIVIGNSEDFSARYTTGDNINYTSNSNFTLAPPMQGFPLNSSSTTQSFSSQKILYDGTGNFVDITGLESGKMYAFTVVEYNGTGNNKDYKQENEFMTSITTYTSSVINSVFNKIIGRNSYTQDISPIFNFFDANKGVFYSQMSGFLTTNNGGLSWKTTSNSINKQHINNYFWPLCSSWQSNGTGFIGFSDGKIAKTIDFGNNWSIINLNIGRVYAVQITNDNSTGFIASGGASSSTYYSSGGIFKTTNNGISWTLLNSFSRPATALNFINSNEGWVALGGANYGDSNFCILKTLNGGASWVTYELPLQNKGYFISDIKFFNQNKGIAVTSLGYILSTNNGGATWNESNIFGNVVTSENYDKFPKIKFINDNLGFINFRNQKLAKTTDGGLNWSIIDIQGISSGWIGDICALSENEIYVGGEAGILKTTTGGSANTIAVNTLAQSSYCVNQQISLPYTITGIYNPTNVFNVELSDASGSFTSAVVLQSFTNVGGGTLSVSLPQNILVGAGYKLRIVGTSPNLVSNISNAFAVTAAPSTSLVITPTTTTICPNTNLTFTATPTNGGTAPTYTWKKNGVVVGSNSATYNATGLNNGDIVWAEMVSNQACGSSTPVIATPTTINVTQIDSPFIQAIDNILAASTDVGVQWIRNGQPIAGATSQFYEATQTGFYQFSVTVSGCTVLSDIYQLTTLGTDDNVFNSNTISVYPNPTNDVLHIKSIDNTLTNLVLIDLQGRKISEHKTNGNTYQIDLQNLPSAIYLLQIETDKGKQTVKVVKK